MSDVVYTDDPGVIEADQLRGGFFERWPDRPDAERHLDLLRGAEAVILALDPETAAVVGFVSAIGDGVLTAFIPLLEVLPAWRGQGIGNELMRRILNRLGDRYSVDLVCDPELVPFYQRLGGTAGTAVLWRRTSR
ncbi:MAG TPA: GNAT family N-acetyltransferase [Candidatus Deferrimicrobium sp.]|nr:GNAT family N-acetyltransferase [Candidatus Deferrimicrobium sp.]